MISNFIESLASFSISASKNEFCAVVSLKIGVFIAVELLINPVDKNSNRSPVRLFKFNLSVIFVSNAKQKYRVKNN